MYDSSQYIYKGGLSNHRKIGSLYLKRGFFIKMSIQRDSVIKL